MITANYIDIAGHFLCARVTAALALTVPLFTRFRALVGDPLKFSLSMKKSQCDAKISLNWYSETIVSWYNLPSPSPPTSSHLRPHPHPLCLFCLHSAPTPMCTCTTCTTTMHPLLD